MKTSTAITVNKRELLKLLDAGCDVAQAFWSLANRGTANAADRRHAKRLAQKFFGLARPFPDPYACRVCGCTEDRACDNGCWWIEEPKPGEQGLCSSCAPTPAPKKTRRRK